MRLIVFALVAFASAGASAASLDYEQARALAGNDEASLTADQSDALAASQAAVGGPAVAECRLASGGIIADLAPFTVVMELDAQGKVIRTWRQGDSPMAACFEQAMRKGALAPPPRTPFYTFFSMHWDD